MKFSKICFVIFVSVLLIANCLNTEENKKKHKRSKSKSRKATVDNADKPNVNKTFMNYSYSVLNASSTLDLAGFHAAKVWDYKIMDKQFSIKNPAILSIIELSESDYNDFIKE